MKNKQKKQQQRLQLYVVGTKKAAFHKLAIIVTLFC